MSRSGRKAVLALLVSVLVIGIVEPAHASPTWTPWKCATSGCKYGSFRAAYDGNWILNHRYFGSTASGVCDPSNTGVRWQLLQTSVFKGNTLVHQTGGDDWRTNCTTKNTPPPPTHWDKFIGSVSISPPRSSHMWQWNEHSCTGCSWQIYVRHDY